MVGNWKTAVRKAGVILTRRLQMQPREGTSSPKAKQGSSLQNLYPTAAPSVSACTRCLIENQKHRINWSFSQDLPGLEEKKPVCKLEKGPPLG